MQKVNVFGIYELQYRMLPNNAQVVTSCPVGFRTWF